jgi:hypothetical protein
MKVPEGFPLPAEDVRAHGYRILDAIYATSKETDCTVASEATLYAAALMLLACSKQECVAEILKTASDVLLAMSKHPTELISMKAVLAVSKSGRLN